MKEEKITLQGFKQSLCSVWCISDYMRCGQKNCIVNKITKDNKDMVRMWQILEDRQNPWEIKIRSKHEK